MKKDFSRSIFTQLASLSKASELVVNNLATGITLLQPLRAKTALPILGVASIRAARIYLQQTTAEGIRCVFANK